MRRRLTKRFSVEETLVQYFGHDEEGTEIEPEIEEDVSEVEDNTDFDPDFENADQSTDEEGEAPEEQAPEEAFPSENRHLLRSSSPQERGNRTRVENVIKMTPRPTRSATSRVVRLQKVCGMQILAGLYSRQLRPYNSSVSF